MFLNHLVFTFLYLSCVNGASVLFYFGLSGVSHRIAVWPLVERLAADGHDVTFLSCTLPNKPNPNVTEFSPQALRDFMSQSFGEDSDLISVRMAGQHLVLWDGFEGMAVTMCDMLMDDEEYLGLLKNKKFDLVIVDMLYNDCAYGIIHYQKAKFVIYDTTHPMQWQYDMFGIPAETSYISDIAHGYKLPMSFPTRFINTLRPLTWYFGFVFNVHPALERTINDKLGLSGDNALSISRLEKNCSLVFTNTHFSVEHSRSLPPLYVSVAGLHIEKSQGELPKELKKFIEESGPDGFIYISFGSGAQVSKTKPEFQRMFFNSLRKFKTRFIWKWEGDTVPEEMPSNVYTAKWMPQKDILAHPNVKAFMTHGGLLGIQEAVVKAVPLIVFPFFAEQDYNAERVQRLGYGITLEARTLTEEDVTNAIHAVLTNSSYKEKMQEVSTFFNDRQNDPLETAVWWVEFILRNKHNPLIMPLGAYQPWYVRRSLDVWGSIIGGFFFIIGLIAGFGCRRSSKSEKVKVN